MILVVVVADHRIEYLAADIRDAGLSDRMMPAVVSDPAVSAAVSEAGLFDVQLVDDEPVYKPGIVRRLLNVLDRKVIGTESRAGNRTAQFAGRLEWRLRKLDRGTRLIQPKLTRRRQQRFPVRLSDRVLDVLLDYEVSEVWVYDAWTIGPVLDAVGPERDIVVRIR